MGLSRQSKTTVQSSPGAIPITALSVSSDLQSGVSQIFSNNRSFAALKSDGSVVTWGDSQLRAAPISSSGVSKIFTSGRAISQKSGSVITWGESSHGGDSSSVSADLQSGVSKIFDSTQAFAALKHDGSVVTGQSSYGGDSSVSADLQSGVTQIFDSTYYSFAALKGDGSVVTWGDSTYGGDSSSVSSELSSGVVSLR